MKNNNLKISRLEIVVFLCGAVVMIIELVGSRVVSPYFGNSLVVWTSLIGVILGSLSVGYYYGGRLADRGANFETLGRILLWSALFTGLTAFIKEPGLTYISHWFGTDLRAGSFMAVLLLFGPVSFLLGMVSPYVAKLKMNSLNNSGKVVGNLSALSTLGSISGTFLAGFVLIPFFGNSVLLYVMSVILLGTSVIALQKILAEHLITIMFIGAMFFLNQKLAVFKLRVVSDVDSLYNRIIVKQIRDYQGNDLYTMSTDSSGIQSAIKIEYPEELYFGYSKAYAWSESINPKINSALMIGGGGYSYPRYFLKTNLESRMDVVEIDPKMTELAKKYFSLIEDPRMTIIHQDARSFVRRSKKTYEVIFLDAFNSVTPPAHLTTQEFMSDLSQLLTDNGFLMINLISSITGPRSEFLLSERETLRTVFPRVDIYETESRNPQSVQNLMLIAYKDSSVKKLSLRTPISNFDKQTGRVLTDDWSPVEYLSRNLYTP